MNPILWRPDGHTPSQMARYMADKGFSSYTDLHRWSISKPQAFWQDLLARFELIHEGDPEPALARPGFESYGWFPGLRLNFAENLLAKGGDHDIALNFVHESGSRRQISYARLREQSARLQTFLRPLLGPQETLAAYMPNTPETVIGMLAATSLGGVFTSTSCDFGVEGALERFGQCRPKVLLAAAGYQYNGKHFDQRDKIAHLAREIPSLEAVILTDTPSAAGVDKAITWEELPRGEELSFERVAFADPAYILYSSGTTGRPKAIVHSVGGTLLQHLKELSLHCDLTREKNICYFTTCGWMMWNWLVSSLHFGAKVTLYEGSPSHPSLEDFFGVIAREQINIFGTSPKFLRALQDSGYDNDLKLDSLATILTTGAPLLPEQFDFVYQKIKSDLCLSSICGGTDIIGCFMLGNPALPVRRGEIQCLGLGMDVACFNAEGEELVNQEGELVCRKTFPSRPVRFLGDPDGAKIRRAYFERYPGVWHHGDFIHITNQGGVCVHGRSDATLNPSGVRIGTAEIYRQTEKIDFLADSLCVGLQATDDVVIVLFVKMIDGKELTSERIERIKRTIREGTSPRHVPRHIRAVSDIPYTRSGKKMELPVSRLLAGRTPENIEAVANADCLEEYRQIRAELVSV